METETPVETEETKVSGASVIPEVLVESDVNEASVIPIVNEASVIPIVNEEPVVPVASVVEGINYENQLQSVESFAGKFVNEILEGFDKHLANLEKLKTNAILLETQRKAEEEKRKQRELIKEEIERKKIKNAETALLKRQLQQAKNEEARTKLLAEDEKRKREVEERIVREKAERDRLAIVEQDKKREAEKIAREAREAQAEADRIAREAQEEIERVAREARVKQEEVDRIALEETTRKKAAFLKKTELITKYKSLTEDFTIKTFLDQIKQKNNSTSAKKLQIDTVLTTNGITNEDINKISESMKSFDENSEILTIDELQAKLIELNTLIENFKIKNLSLIISQIEKIFSSMSRSDIEAIPKYNDFIKQLAICWKTIMPPNNAELDPEIKTRIDDTANLFGSNITGAELLKALKGSYDLYIEILKIDPISPLEKLKYDSYRIKIEQFMSDELKEKIGVISNDIRIIYETILGAAMVILRIKPLISHNTAPTYGEIKTFMTTYDINKFTVRDYLKMKSREIQKQRGGYKYEDIINIDDKGIVKIGNFCKDILSANSTGYGPFAGIYTPEYNNFDIYAYLFGTQKLGEPESIGFKPPSNLDTNDYGTLQYTQNTSQKLMSKLTKGGNVVLFGYGFSGSGKTYALLEGSKIDSSKLEVNQKYDPSLLEQFMKDNSEFITKIEFLDIYPLGVKVNDKTIRIFCSKEAGSDPVLKKLYGEGFYNVQVEYNSEVKPSNGNITFDTIKKRISDLEIYRRQQLRICATPNNDSSSRSFLQITVHLERQGTKNKIIFFDMPGTENTVRIRTEFLGAETFDIVKKLSLSVDNKDIKLNRPKAETDVDKLIYSIFEVKGEEYKSKEYKINQIKLKDTTPETLRILKKAKEDYDINNSKTVMQFVTYFKGMIVTKIMLEKFAGLNNASFEYISDVAQAIILFFNGLSIESIFDIKTDQPIKFINKTIIRQICNYFITNVILREKELKTGETKQEGEYMYFSLQKTTQSTKLQSQEELLISNDDYKNIETVFGISNIASNDKLSWKTQKDSSSTTIIKDQSLVWDFITIIENPDKVDEYNTSKTYVQIIAGNQKYKYVKNKKDGVDQDHPLIRYFITIMNTIISNNPDYDDFYGCLLLFIYKYIKFIVDQGSAIVTTLEHLKFFFLSNTNNVEKYNKTYEKKKYTLGDASTYNSILTNKRIYNTKTKVGSGDTYINERINMGNMNDYRLLSILQYLAQQEYDLNNLASKTYKNKNVDESTLDLFHRKTISASSPTETKQQKSSFVMFTNIKIFRDDSSKANGTDKVNEKTNNDLVKNLNLLCPAEYDTLEFAQSISSTTQTVNDSSAITQEIQEEAEAEAEAPVAALLPATEPVAALLPAQVEEVEQTQVAVAPAPALPALPALPSPAPEQVVEPAPESESASAQVPSQASVPGPSPASVPGPSPTQPLVAAAPTPVAASRKAPPPPQANPNPTSPISTSTSPIPTKSKKAPATPKTNPQLGFSHSTPRVLGGGSIPTKNLPISSKQKFNMTDLLNKQKTANNKNKTKRRAISFKNVSHKRKMFSTKTKKNM